MMEWSLTMPEGGGGNVPRGPDSGAAMPLSVHAMEPEFDEGRRRELIVEAVGKIIQGQQEEILAAVELAVRQHISAKSPRECLELVLLQDDGSVARTLQMEASASYAKALIAFVRGQQFDGYSMDSGLTGPTATIVGDVFADRIGERSSEIVEQLIPLLVSDRRFVEALSYELVTAYSSTLPQTLQRKMVGLLTHKLGAALAHTIDTVTMATVKASVVKAATVAVSSPIAMKITASLLTSMAAALKPIILKLLASSAFKAAIVAKLKAIVVGSLLGAFIKIIGVKLGLSAGAMFMWIVDVPPQSVALESRVRQSL
jgi:hypothetical protein